MYFTYRTDSIQQILSVLQQSFLCKLTIKLQMPYAKFWLKTLVIFSPHAIYFTLNYISVASRFNLAFIGFLKLTRQRRDSLLSIAWIRFSAHLIFATNGYEVIIL